LGFQEQRPDNGTCYINGRSLLEPLPEQYLHIEQKLMNEKEPARAKEMGTDNTPCTTRPVRPNRPLCTHPQDERAHFGAVEMCLHCYTLRNEAETEEGKAHSAAEAA
jgi:hypothetical protein